jgi:hypothetical protein
MEFIAQGIHSNELEQAPSALLVKHLGYFVCKNTDCSGDMQI